MEIVTLDIGAPYKHLFLRVIPGSQYENRVIVFRMGQCAYIVDWDYIACIEVHFSIQLQARPGQTLHTTRHNMEEASHHAASLLASLNLQREQAQFCDCVITQRQSPGQLHPAHRCVLAASSPVLASILSSTGALVELQAQCLSDAVLPLLLEYIYTGALPCTHSQHQYHSLLTAASYLQMDELQEALRANNTCASDGGEDNTCASAGGENQPYQDINNTYSATVNNCRKYLPLSMEREDHQYSANADTCDVKDPFGINSKNGANPCSRKGARTLSNLTPQDSIQNIPCTSEIHRASGVDKEVQKHQFLSAHSAGTEEELEKTTEDRRSSFLICTAVMQAGEMSSAKRNHRLRLTVKSKAEEKQSNRKEEDMKDNVLPSQCSSSSSSSSPHLCCGAVPVIRHSSGAAMLQLAGMSPMPPPYQSVSQSSVSSSRAPNSLSGSTDSGSIIEGITTRPKKHNGEQNPDYRDNKDHTGTQSWDQSDILKQDYSSSNTAHLTGQNDDHVSNGLSHITDNDWHYSFQKRNHTKHPRDDSVPKNKDPRNVARGLQNKTDQSFDDFPSKLQRLDCSDCHNVLMATAAEQQSIVFPLPVPDSDAGSDSHCEDLCSEGEAKQEHSYSSCPAETDEHNGHYEPKTNWYLNLHKAETCTEDVASSQHKHTSDNRDAAMTDKRHSVDLCLPVSTTPESHLDSVTAGLSGFECCTAVELEKMSEPHIAITMSADQNMSDPTYSVVGPSYRGRLQYHCLPQEETHISYGQSGRKHCHPSHPDHPYQSSDEGEVGTFASPGYSPLRQDFTRITDQVLLLDISAKPAELLVSNAFGQKETFQNRFGNREQWTEATSVAGVDTKYWVGETNVDERSVGKDQSRPGAEVIHKAGVAEGVSNPKDDENQTTTLTVCSPPSVPDFVQASVSSTLSVCIPSTLSASMPKNMSAHLLNPVHQPFQCSLCDRSFSQRGSLNRHVRSHLGVRPFPCPRCPMTFSRQYRVIEHMRVHQRCVLGSDFPQPPASSV